MAAAEESARPGLQLALVRREKDDTFEPERPEKHPEHAAGVRRAERDVQLHRGRVQRGHQLFGPEFPGPEHPSAPAEAAGGVKMLKSLLGAFRHTGVRIMPTGGIHAGNIGSWLEIPEVAACGGSWICEPSLIQSSEWEEIGRRTREALRAL